VTPGDTLGENVAISSGLEPGDMVVAEGAFFLRAERERLP
jgi:multidrug efflux pump subunit AcrA (membrane-fusion protein)